MAYSTDVWSLCDNTPLFKDSPMLKSKLEYNQCLLKVNQYMVYQGVLDNCHDVGITEIDLQEAQAPRKQIIRRPAQDDWERQRKYSGNLSVDITKCTFKHTT